jgi:hypothetical protein
MSGTEGYGGIFLVGRPFEFNLKCLVISFAAAGIYMLPRYSAKHTMFMVAFIFVIVYIMISFYDYLYNCSAKMYSRGVSPTSIFKPQYRLPPFEVLNGEALAENQEKMYLRSVYFFHALGIAPLLLIGSWKAMRFHKKTYDGEKKPKDDRSYGFLPIIFGTGAVAMFYHLMRIRYPRDVWP